MQANLLRWKNDIFYIENKKNITLKYVITDRDNRVLHEYIMSSASELQ
jgi:hypothetical protein